MSESSRKMRTGDEKKIGKIKFTRLYELVTIDFLKTMLFVKGKRFLIERKNDGRIFASDRIAEMPKKHALEYQ